MVHTFKTSTWDIESQDLYGLNVGLVYKASSRTARAFTQRSPTFENQRWRGEGGGAEGNINNLYIAKITKTLMEGDKLHARQGKSGGQVQGRIQERDTDQFFTEVFYILKY